jgi:hypothetical protein
MSCVPLPRCLPPSIKPSNASTPRGVRLAGAREASGGDLPNLLNGGWQSDAHSAEDGTAASPGLGVQTKTLVVMLNLDFLERVEVSEHIGPLVHLPGRLEAIEQRLAQDQREKRTENMAAEGLVTRVEEGARLEQRLGGAKQGLDLPQRPVLERDLLGG